MACRPCSWDGGAERKRQHTGCTAVRRPGSDAVETAESFRWSSLKHNTLLKLEGESLQSKYEQRMPRRYRDPLLAIHAEGHNVGVHFSAGLIVPKWLARSGVQRIEVAFHRTTEYQPAASREHARPRRRFQLELPLDRARQRVQRPHCSPGL